MPGTGRCCHTLDGTDDLFIKEEFIFEVEFTVFFQLYDMLAPAKVSPELMDLSSKSVKLSD